MTSPRSILAALILCWAPLPELWGEEFSAADLEFFEKQVRPLLVEKCQKCHGESMQKGGLRLDSRSAVLQGGDAGPAIQPGDVEASLLIEAINYDPDGYQMPPTGKLASEEIAVLTEWVRRQAPWPDDGPKPGLSREGIDLAERARHWSFQPLPHPAVPEIGRPELAEGAIDRFLLARLEGEGLTPAPLAEKMIQLRRLSYELTGLPPTWDEMEAYEADPSPDAYERLIDRLLASPRLGERWARHWLDLVRYAETYGHEFDFEIRYPQPYRDYVIRAFNADVPYDQFVREHVAGDLLPDPRRDPAAGDVESVIGTAFWWFGQGKHSPVDIRAEECDTVDNQLDVFGKTFLGLTIACARCHDHKFDAITQRDYYALAGYLQSSRQTYADVNPPEVVKEIVSELERNDRDQRSACVAEALDRLEAFSGRLADLLLGRGELSRDLVASLQKRWGDEAANDPRHPLHVWVQWSADPSKLQERREALRGGARPSAGETGLPSPQEAADEWFREGELGDVRPERALHWLMQASAERPVRGVVAPQTWIHTGVVSPRLRGTVRSPTFPIDKPFLHVLASRRGGSPNPVHGDYKAGQIHLVVDGFQIIRDPLWGHLTIRVPQRESAAWYRIDASRFLGSRAYLEFEDPDDGELIVEQVVFGDAAAPPLPVNPLISRAVTQDDVRTLEDVAAAYQRVCLDVVHDLQEAETSGNTPEYEDLPSIAAIVNWLLREESQLGSAGEKTAWTRFAARRSELEAAIPAPRLTLAMTAGSPENERLLIRGNPKKPGEEVPRRFLEAFGSVPDPQTNRLDLAERLVDGVNPLPPRVIANRLWQHAFGRGLVPTPDDFGKMGQPPTHPELLDWLARELIRSEWSLKHLLRQMVASRAFRLSSRAEDDRAEELDPQNLLLHRGNIQRLEAEAIRDSLLLLSGRLDDRMYGPSVLPHLTEFMEGRGRPKAGGPLDGDGRRSLYINVRRNFLTPLFLAFEFPTPFTTMGRRSTSNVPAQALSLMNNPLVSQQAEMWVRQTDGAPAAERIRRLYRTAFSRPASDEEVRAAEEFLASQGAEYGSADDPRAWTDLAHVLLNVKEFVFIQ